MAVGRMLEEREVLSADASDAAIPCHAIEGDSVVFTTDDYFRHPISGTACRYMVRPRTDHPATS